MIVVLSSAVLSKKKALHLQGFYMDCYTMIPALTLICAKEEKESLCISCYHILIVTLQY